MKRRLIAHRLRVPVGLLLMALATGCGPKVGSIVGTVTYQGKPVRWGTVKVIWTSSDSESLNAGSSVLNQTGAYEVGRVPAGSSAKLFLHIPLIPMGGMLGGNRPNPRVVNEVKERLGYVDVPEKYTSPQTSGFSLEVKPGTNVFDINLPAEGPSGEPSKSAPRGKQMKMPRSPREKASLNPQRDKCILAIDLGTSGPKVALVSTDGEILASEFEETPLLLLAGGGAEQRPDDWWAAVTAATRRLLAHNACALEDIAAISCTSQYSSTVAVGGDGTPLMNAVNWMDTRGAPHVRRIIGGWPRIQGYGLGKLLTWVRLTGGAPTHSGKDSIAHILYIKAERPDVYRATCKFLEPKDYLNLLLTGEFAASYDSINLHWLTDNRDIAHIRYDARLLSLAGIAPEKLPVLKHATEVLGVLTTDAAEQLGLRGRARGRRDD